jgi:hypothetical protein
MTIEVRLPRDGEYVQINPDPASRRLVTLALDDDGVYYLLAPNVAAQARKERPDRARLYMLCAAQNSDGENFLWPVAATDIQ